jgi:hypothetical protein
VPNLRRFPEIDALNPGEGQPLDNGLGKSCRFLASHVGSVFVAILMMGPAGKQGVLRTDELLPKWIVFGENPLSMLK